MRLRTVEFACFLVLLSAFGGVSGRTRDNCRDCASLHVLLAQIATVSGGEAAQPAPPSVASSQALPAAARTRAVQPWSMRPPAAHSAELHAVTASGL